MAKSINDVIKKANSLADIISKRVAANAPKKTGNLRAALLRANNLNTMLDVGRGGTKSIPLKTITFTIDYAPDGAEYGMWWNDPTVSSTVRSGKTKNVPGRINFVETALNEPQVQRALNDIYDLLGDTILAGIEDELNKMESEY
jgi:hypothetical protein